MKRFSIFILIISIIFAPTKSMAKVNKTLDLDAEGAILIDADTGQILFEKNPHKKLYPASTTKIITAILAIELGNLDDIVLIDKEVSASTIGSHIALDSGEEIPLRELLYALLIESANDSAVAIAKHISGKTDTFVELMNNKAKEIGAKNTNFTNPNGLHNDDHYSTAYDLAMIGRYAMQNKVFRGYVQEYIHTMPPTNKKSEPRYLKSANRMIYSTIKINVDGQIIPTKYEGANGIKTGWTSKANGCLVSSAERNGTHLIAAVLNSQNSQVFVDSHKLLNYGFENYRTSKLGFKDQFIQNFEVKRGLIPNVSGILKEDIYIVQEKNSPSNIKTNVVPNKEILAPIKQGDTLGKIQFSIGDKLLKEEDIVSAIDIPFDPNSSLIRRLTSKWYLFVFALLLALKVYNINRKRKLRKYRKYRNPVAKNK